MVNEITQQHVQLLLFIVLVIVGCVVCYIIGRSLERARWIEASEKLGTEKTIVTIKGTQYLVLQSDEYQQIMNVFSEEP